MKTAAKTALILAAAVLMAAGAWLGTALRRESRAVGGELATLRGRVVALGGMVTNLTAACDRLGDGVAVYSNRAATAEAALRAERATNEPLRRQIEKMIADGIGRDALIEKQNGDIAGLLARGKDLESQLAAMTGERDRTAAELAALRPQYEAAVHRGNELEKQLAAARQESADRQAALTATRASLAAETQRAAGLSNALAAATAQVAAQTQRAQAAETAAQQRAAELESAKAAIAAAGAKLEAETARAAELDRQLAAARTEIEALKTPPPAPEPAPAPAPVPVPPPAPNGQGEPGESKSQQSQ